MPTGYTSKIYEGETMSGKSFILRCARAFGLAGARMRDESLDVQIPEKLEPSNFYKEQVERANERSLKYQNMTLEEAEAHLEESHHSAVQRYYDQLKTSEELRTRYQSTLDEVLNWQPPTQEHENLKDFAINQLQESILRDCSTDYLKYPVKQSAEEYLNSMIEHANREVKYAIENQKKEEEAYNKSNIWLKDLRDSLDNLEG